ncbi:MAG: DUF1232 domain-containing protein, partial [Pyrinomonadaceae bacterium]
MSNKNKLKRREKSELKGRMRNFLMFLPNMVGLLGRMLKDSRVPTAEKALFLAAIVYVVSPLDFIPDIFPFIGQVDDLYVVALTLLRLVNRTDESVVREHWHGGGDVVAGLGFVDLIFHDIDDLDLLARTFGEPLQTFTRILRTFDSDEADCGTAVGAKRRGRLAQCATGFEIVGADEGCAAIFGAVRVEGDDLDPFFPESLHLVDDTCGFFINQGDSHAFDVFLAGELFQAFDLPRLRGIVAEKLDFDSQFCPGFLRASV